MKFVDDGAYKWEEVYEVYKEYFKEIKSSKKSREDKIREIKMYKDFIYDTIHNKLYENRDISDNESKIRELCRYVIKEMLPYIDREINEIDKELRKEQGENYGLAKILNEYLEVEDDLYAIASFRSLIHYAHYMERGDDASQWVWKYNMEDTMGSIFYYSNQMILDNKYMGLIKQCPTGYGR